MEALRRACEIAKSVVEARTGKPVSGDGQTALAGLIGKKQPHIAMWFRRGKVPAEVCADIEAATNGAVTRGELRPDVFREPGATLTVKTDEVAPRAQRRTRAGGFQSRKAA